MSLFDEVKKNLVEWYAVTSEKTTEVARVTSRRYDKFGLSRDIERHFSELGSLIYTGLQQDRDDLLNDAGVKALVERITALEAELVAKNDEIEAIRRDYAERKAQTMSDRGGSDGAIKASPQPRATAGHSTPVEPRVANEDFDDLQK